MGEDSQTALLTSGFPIYGDIFVESLVDVLSSVAVGETDSSLVT